MVLLNYKKDFLCCGTWRILLKESSEMGIYGGKKYFWGYCRYFTPLATDHHITIFVATSTAVVY